MSGASKDWNDLDAGGGGRNTQKRGARPDLQEKMRRRFHHKNQERRAGSSSENTSPVPYGEPAMGQAGAFRRVPEGAAAASSDQRSQRSKNREETPELNHADANGNFMFHEGNDSTSESGRPRKTAFGDQGRNSKGQAATKATGQDHFDKALNSVLGELNRDEQSQRRQRSRGEATAMFENNFDDPESPQVLNIPAGGAAGARPGTLGGNSRAQGGKHNLPREQSQSHGEEADDEDDEMVGLQPEQGRGRDPMQELLQSVIGDGRGQIERGDPLEALLGRRPDGNRNNGGLGELFGGERGGGGDPLAALMGGLPKGNGGGDRRLGERNDNDDPFAALLGAGGRNPFANMMGGDNDAQKNMQNAGNNFRSSIVGNGRYPGGRDPLDGAGQNRQGVGGVGRENRRVKADEKDSDGEEQDEEDDHMEGEKPVALRQPKEDPVRAMLEEMTKGMKGNAKPLAALGRAGAGEAGRGRGGVGNLGGIGAEEGNKNNDPVAAFLGGRGGGGGINPLTMMSGAGKGGGGGGSGLGGLAGFMDGAEQGGRGDGMNPQAAMMGGAGRGGGGGGSGFGGRAGLMGGGAPDGGEVGDLAGMLGGGGSGANPLSALMGDGAGGQGGNPLAALMGGAGRGGGGSGGNPLAALMGGGGAGGNPLAALMGGGGAGGNPLAALMAGAGRGGGGTGGNPLAALMGGAGRGGGGGDLAGLAGMLGGGAGGSGAGGDAMSQALAAVMGGSGGGGANPMASAMSALMGGGRGKPEGPQEQLLRQMMGQAGVEEDELSPDNAGENDIIQQLLAYEMMRAQSNRAPRAEQAMHTVIVVDTSGSMDGEPLREAGQFISQFINGLEELQFEYNLQENVALVCVGGETQVVQHFTNDYSLIRRGTDSLCAVGSSRLHMGLLIPTSLLSHGGQDNRRAGGIYEMGGHMACPRVIFISDGYPNATDDVPGHQPRPDDKTLLAMQNLCVELTHSVVEKTLCKIYCVPVGNCNLNFMEILSHSTGGRVMQPTDAKHMSRCLLHHVLVSKLHESSKQEPTRDAVAEMLQQVTATAEESDINGVFEVIREGEPDVQARDQRYAQEMMQAMQGRGRGRGGGGGGRGDGGGRGGDMQELGEMAALMGQGQGQVPGGLQSMMRMAGRGGRRGGIPMMRSRGRPGGDMGMMDEEGEGSGGLKGLQAMLGMSGGRGRGGGGGMDDLVRIDGGGRSGDGGGGGFEGLRGMGGGGRGGGAGGLGALLRMGGGGGLQSGGGRGEGHDMEAVMRMAGGGRGRGEGGGNEALMRRGGGVQDMLSGGGGGQAGEGGLGLMGSGDGKSGGDSVHAIRGLGGGNCGLGDGDSKEYVGNRGIGGMFNIGSGISGMLGMGGWGGQNEQQRGGLGHIPGGSLQAMLGTGDDRKEGQDIEDDKRQTRNDLQQRLLRMGNEDQEKEQGRSMFADLPGGSLQAMLGMEDKGKHATGKQGDSTGQEKGTEKRVTLGSGGGGGLGDGTGLQSMMGFGGGDGSGSFGQLLGMGGRDGQRPKGDGMGQLPGGNVQGILGMGADDGQSCKNRRSERPKSPPKQENREDAALAGSKSKPKQRAGKADSDKKVPAAAGSEQQSCEEDDESDRDSPVLGLLNGGEAGGGNANNIPQRQNYRGNGIFNNVPPMSFGLDEHGNARNVDLIGGLGENDKEGDELMEKLSEMLGIGDGSDGGGILGANADEGLGNQGNGGGLLRGLPDMLGLGGGRAGRMPGMPGNPDNRPPNLGGAPSDITTFLQNVSRESMAQNEGGLRDDDGDVIMGRLGAMGQAERGDPFADLGGIGGGNLPFLGGANRGQQAAPLPQGLGQAMNGAPNNLQQLEQMLQNAQGGNQGMPSLEQLFGQLGMGGMGQPPDRGQGGGWAQ